MSTKKYLQTKLVLDKHKYKSIHKNLIDKFDSFYCHKTIRGITIESL